MSDLNQSLDETLKLLEFPESDVRKSAVEAVTEFTIAYFKDGSAPSSAEACQKSLSGLLPKLCEMVADDEDIDVVCVCLENVARLLKVGLKFKLNYVHV